MCRRYNRSPSRCGEVDKRESPALVSCPRRITAVRAPEKAAEGVGQLECCVLHLDIEVVQFALQTPVAPQRNDPHEKPNAAASNRVRERADHRCNACGPLTTATPKRRYHSIDCDEQAEQWRNGRYSREAVHTALQVTLDRGRRTSRGAQDGINYRLIG